MKVLVTGIAGFIGSNFAKYLLEKKIQVVGVDNFSSSYSIKIAKQNLESVFQKGEIEFIEGDITNKELFKNLESKKITHIVHLGAKAGVRDSTLIPEEYLRTNILGTLNVLEFAKKMNVKKVVLASTSSAYGKNPVPSKENQVISTPLSIYAASKTGMEALAYSFYHLHKLPIVVLRIFTIYGPGGRADMAVYTFTNLISKGKEIEVWGNLEVKRDFTFVTDACEAFLLALKSNCDYGVFNISSSKTRTLKELISLIEKSIGKKAKMRFIEKNSEDPDVTFADISKAKNFFGYSPKISLEKGIPIFVEWFKKHKQ